MAPGIWASDMPGTAESGAAVGCGACAGWRVREGILSFQTCRFRGFESLLLRFQLVFAVEGEYGAFAMKCQATHLTTPKTSRAKPRVSILRGGGIGGFWFPESF